MFRDYFIFDTPDTPVLNRAKVRDDAITWYSRPGVSISRLDGPGSACKYRLDGTAACATRCLVGLMMADSEYRPSFEDDLLGDIVRLFVTNPSYEDVVWLRNAQQVHDYAEDNDQLVKSLLALTLLDVELDEDTDIGMNDDPDA